MLLQRVQAGGVRDLVDPLQRKRRARLLCGQHIARVCQIGLTLAFFGHLLVLLQYLVVLSILLLEPKPLYSMKEPGFLMCRAAFQPLTLADMEGIRMQFRAALTLALTVNSCSQAGQQICRLGVLGDTKLLLVTSPDMKALMLR